MRHIAHWRSVKYVDVFNEEREEEGETVIRKRERFSQARGLAPQTASELFDHGSNAAIPEADGEGQLDGSGI